VVATEGDFVGAGVGCGVGSLVVATEGDFVGAAEGDFVGAGLGCGVGSLVGAAEGDFVGAGLGDAVGDRVGASVTSTPSIYSFRTGSPQSFGGVTDTTDPESNPALSIRRRVFPVPYTWNVVIAMESSVAE
jgi:hypothetical protein